MSQDFEHIVSEYDKRRKQERDATRTALLDLTDQLRAAGVRQVCATFNGYGDEGALEGVEFVNAKGEAVAGLGANQFDNLEAHFLALLPLGYEQNEGSSGTVCLDVEKRRIMVDVNWNVSTTENEIYEV